MVHFMNRIINVQFGAYTRLFTKLICDNCFNSSKNIHQQSPKFGQTDIRSIVGQLKTQSIYRKMPKESSKKLNAEKSKGKKYPASTFFLQVIGSGAPGAPTALYASAGQYGYLFNCGEGCQRLAYEYKVKLSTVENIFVTHKSWRNVGGMPGMFLTLQDAGLNSLRLHGPPGIHALYEDTSTFMSFDAMDLTYHHYDTNNGVFGEEDDPLVITAVPILPSSENRIPSPASQAAEFVIFKGGGEPGRGMKRDNTDEAEVAREAVKRSKSDEYVADLAMLYIGKLAPKLGKLMLELCVKAKVPPGPLYGQLKNGKDVVLADGSVVRAVDVTEPDDPGPVFIVAEAPTMDHLTTLANHPSLTLYQKPGTEYTAEVVVHFTPLSVLETKEYKDWMKTFAPSTQHILINEGNTCCGSFAIHRNQIKLNYIHPYLYPLLADTSLPDAVSKNPSESQNEGGCIQDAISADVASTRDISSAGAVNIQNSVSEANGASSNRAVAERPSLIDAVTMLTYDIRPKFGLHRGLCPVIERDCIEGEIAESGCTRGAAAAMPKEFPEVTFLGTGSAVPNKTRNVSGILVETSADNFMLLDCGEGTLGQLFRLLGVPKTEDVLSKLRGVFISHHHADHHIGLISFIQRRSRVLFQRGLPVTPLLVLAPSTIISYLRSYHQHFESIFSLYSLLVNNKFFGGSAAVPSCEWNSWMEDLRLQDLRTCYVPHCKESFGIRLTTLEGKSLVYSGDTRPCHPLIEMGKGCDMLIHEATMEDFLVNEAKIKRHCTISEAITVARKMEAKNVMLTHFSQRYSKVPMIPEDFTEDLSNVAFASDFMRVSPSGVRLAATVHPELLKMFSEYVEIMKCKTTRKLLGRERRDALKIGGQIIH